jgi:hypothetical protein
LSSDGRFLPTNEHLAGLSIVAWPPEDGEPKRAIAVHALENLATSDTGDTGISMPRWKLREQIESGCATVSIR